MHGFLFFHVVLDSRLAKCFEKRANIDLLLLLFFSTKKPSMFFVHCEPNVPWYKLSIVDKKESKRGLAIEFVGGGSSFCGKG
jgi:hypothetical protein